MAKPTKPLTSTEVDKAKIKAKEYNLADGKGLMLRIKPNCSKLWLLNYTNPNTGKRANLSLGTYPDISLSNARKAAADARELLSQGIDPKAHREQSKAEAVAIVENTVLNVAKRWFEVKETQITKNHAEDIWRSVGSFTL